ncbi:MAG TPA: hypothetical protein VE821_06920, partial [Pyrinomonadaceae bacterium]|nr:hypothetical protein [Pyrinomonadaceae bacterium]
MIKRSLIGILFLLLTVGAGAQTHTVREQMRVPLTHNWLIQSSAQVQAQGDAISQRGFQTKGWY